jgi:proprotein convertase subtilisin/kexin type 5
LGCADTNALSCPFNIQYSTSCVVGYSPISGVCRQCAANCFSCGVAGAGNCDDSSCSSGYVKLIGTNNCTLCFSSCASCSTNNPMVCLTCGGSSFISNTSSCTACPTACLSCSSLSVCTSCPQGSTLDSGWCYTSLSYPCSSQSKATCTSCYLGFNLINGGCVVDTSCNGTNSCVNCDKGYYLSSGQCLACSTDPTTCDYCQPLQPSSCLYCASTYYFSRSASICKLCSSVQTGCQLC